MHDDSFQEVHAAIHLATAKTLDEFRRHDHTAVRAFLKRLQRAAAAV